MIGQFSDDGIGWKIRVKFVICLMRRKQIVPYIKGTSETISRILQSYNIRVAHKPTTMLRQLLTNC